MTKMKKNKQITKLCQKNNQLKNYKLFYNKFNKYNLNLI